MQIINETPFPVALMLWQDMQGQAKLTVIVKATFSFLGDKPLIADRHLPILTTDEHHGESPFSSVRCESDMVPTKPLADIVLVGKAHAPKRRPVSKLDVSLQVGTVIHTVRVFGDRKWIFPTGAAVVPMITSPDLFLTMDLVYERAYGGIDEASAAYCRENPLGTGLIGTKTKEAVHGKALPNLEDPRDLIDSWDSHPHPVGFGFYGRGWLPRSQHAGTYDDDYPKQKTSALPKDFSYAVFNGAHPRLQVKGYLRGDEEVVMTNLSTRPVVRFRLPGVIPQVSVRKWTASPEQWIEEHSTDEYVPALADVPAREESVPVVLDTLVFMPEEEIFYEVFRCVCPLTTLDEPEVAAISVRMRQ